MLELIIVLMLTGIVINYAVPSYQNLIQQQQIRMSMDSFVTSLELARNTSISRNQQVMLCPSIDGLICHGEKFEYGWILFSDLDQNGQRDPSLEALIWVQDKLHRRLTMRASKAYQYGIAFISSGRLARGFSGNVTLCTDDSTEHAIKIIVIASGRMRTEESNISHCNIR